MSSVKVAGTWRDITEPHVKIGENWKIANSAWSKIDGKWKSWFLQGGVLDVPLGGEETAPQPTFNTNLGLGAGSTVNSIAIQSDGKILLSGNFATFNGVTVNRIVRLNADGTRDTAFTTNTGTGATTTITSIAIQSDGKIVLGGGFTTFNGATVTRIVRLNADGTRDTAFTTNAGTGANGTVNSLVIQSDGKIVLGGSFTTFNGVTVNRIVRLNADGTRDTTFTTNAGTGTNGVVSKVETQSDGKILIGGSFSGFNGVTVNRIVRLNSNGTRDTTFTTNTGTGADGIVDAIAIQSDGKIILGGDFTTFNSATVNEIVRLNANGTRDTAFTTNTGTGTVNGVEVIVIQTDGKIIIGGGFTTFNGVTVNRIVRLNADGTRDTAFTTNTGTGAGSTVNSIAIQSDGKILIGGVFATFNGVTVNRIVRLNADGTADQIAGADDSVFAIAIQSDGKIVLGGLFTIFNGVTVNRIVRLNSDGTRDTAFTTNTGTAFNSTVNAIAIQSDGKIVIGGDFTTFNGTTVNRIARLNSDGTRDTAFTTNTGTGFDSAVFAIAIQSDGKIVLGGLFTIFNGVTVNRIVRLNADGTRDTAFTTNTGTGAGSTVNAIAIQSDGKILLGGAFLTFNSVTVNRIVRLNADGTRDTAFTTNTGTGANSTVNAVAIQSDGKILLGGNFISFNGVTVTVNRIVRLNADGTRDTAFTTNAGTGANDQVNAIAIQSDGKILIGGIFTTFNGVTVNRIVRLNSNGSPDTAFTTNTGTAFNSSVNKISIQSDGKIVLVGLFTTFNGLNRIRLARIGGDTSGIVFEYLIIAGGGPGGTAVGNFTNSGTGGGGAGGYLTGFQNFNSSNPYTVTVGAGASANGLEVGSGSVFGSISTVGGGGGGSASAPNGKAGASGGGAGFPSPTVATSGGTGTAGQGFAGGNRTGEASGGGGGAGGLGGSGAGTTRGLGGIGLASSITGTSITRARGGAGNYSASPLGNTTDPAPNTGDGGGGGVNNRASSAWGASGVVIIRYANNYPNMVIGSGLVIDDGSNGNISGSGTRLAPSFTPAGFKVYRFKSGTGNVSW
jgi:uncharacterized delta-60 repeat protein